MNGDDLTRMKCRARMSLKVATRIKKEFNDPLDIQRVLQGAVNILMGDQWKIIEEAKRENRDPESGSG